MAPLQSENEYRPDLEEIYDKLDAQAKAAVLRLREQRRKFSIPDKDIINGRPHHLVPWITGALANLGFRRK